MNNLLVDFKRDIGQIYRVCVNILNISRSFDDLSFQMELLAKNGAIHATKISRQQGKPLIALVENLFDLSEQIRPVIEQLEEKCTELFRNIENCSIAVIRFYNYVQAILGCLDQLEVKEKDHLVMMAATEAMTIYRLTHSLKDLCEELPQLKKKAATQAMDNEAYDLADSAMKATHQDLLSHHDQQTIKSLDRLVHRCMQNLDMVSEMLDESLKFVEYTVIRLETIRSIGMTVKYIATNISINACNLEKNADLFQSLSEDTKDMVQALEKKQKLLWSQIEDGRYFLKILLKQSSEA